MESLQAHPWLWTFFVGAAFTVAVARSWRSTSRPRLRRFVICLLLAGATAPSFVSPGYVAAIKLIPAGLLLVLGFNEPIIVLIALFPIGVVASIYFFTWSALIPKKE